jgi:hypothetical protein
MNTGLRTLLRQAVFRCYGSTKIPPREIIKRCPTMKFHEQDIPCLACLTKSTIHNHKTFGCEKHNSEATHPEDWQTSMNQMLELEELEEMGELGKQ